MKEELTDLLETAANQMKQRQEQMKLYGRTRLSVTLGIKAQRTLDLAKEKLDALEKQVEKDHTKWISPISDEEYEARQKMCQMMRRLLPDQPVSRKIAAAAKEERASRAASPSSSSSSSI
jgi:hypothetical protein